MSPARKGRSRFSSAPKPVMRVRSKKTHESTRVRNNAPSVPANATVVVGETPCVRYSVTKAITAAATTATATGSLPSRTDGAMKTTKTKR